MCCGAHVENTGYLVEVEFSPSTMWVPHMCCGAHVENTGPGGNGVLSTMWVPRVKIPDL